MTHLLGPRIGEVCPKVDDETQGNEVTILGEGGGGGLIRGGAMHNGNNALTTKKR